jgi:hypothetical protein
MSKLGQLVKVIEPPVEMYDHIASSESRVSLADSSAFLIAMGLAQPGLRVTYFVDQPSTCSSDQVEMVINITEL